jgi:monoamine oxidase
MDVATRVGVSLEDQVPRLSKHSKFTLVLDGKPMSRSEWADSPRNPFPPALREMMPWQYVPLVTSQENPLTSTEGWYDPKNAPFDISMRDFLRKQGATDPMIDIAYDTIPTYGLNAKDISALMMAYVSAYTAAQKSAKPVMLQARGGNQNIPIAMTAQLKQPVRLRQTVKLIEATDAGVSVRTADGARYTARAVICAVPFTTLRRINLRPDFAGMQERAVKSLPYQPIHQVALQASRPFWEDDGLEPSMWTDAPIGRVSAVYHEAKEDQVSSLLVSAFGPGARHLDRLGKEGAARYVVAQIEQMRPAAKGVLQVTGHHSWEQDSFAGGAWAYFNPGTVTKFLPAMFQPRGRVHFCGEHTSVSARGMEGAIESGERAAGAVAQQLA